MLSQTTEYALRAMACMALRPGELMPTPLLAKQAHVPPNYLAKVLQQLAASRLIEGRRGVGGGYRLSRPASEINLLDIIGAIGEIRRIRQCPLGLAEHESEMCPLHKRADAAAQAVMKIYGTTTLQDLLVDDSPNRPLCGMQNGVNLTVSAPNGAPGSNGSLHPPEKQV